MAQACEFPFILLLGFNLAFAFFSVALCVSNGELPLVVVLLVALAIIILCVEGICRNFAFIQANSYTEQFQLNHLYSFT